MDIIWCYYLTPEQSLQVEAYGTKIHEGPFGHCQIHKILINIAIWVLKGMKYETDIFFIIPRIPIFFIKVIIKNNLLGLQPIEIPDLPTDWFHFHYSAEVKIIEPV